MNTPNPSLRPVRRVYWLTPAGSRLARYLDYVQSTPTVSADIMFADTCIPEQHDEDRDTEDPDIDDDMEDERWYRMPSEEEMDFYRDDDGDYDDDDYGDHSPEED